MALVDAGDTSLLLGSADAPPVVEQNPQLKPDWDKAMEDGVLTWPEANAILEKVGEKADPEP